MVQEECIGAVILDICKSPPVTPLEASSVFTGTYINSFVYRVPRDNVYSGHNS